MRARAFKKTGGRQFKVDPQFVEFAQYVLDNATIERAHLKHLQHWLANETGKSWTGVSRKEVETEVKAILATKAAKKSGYGS